MTEVRLTITDDPLEIEVTVSHPMKEVALAAGTGFMSYLTQTAVAGRTAQRSAERAAEPEAQS